MKAAKNLIKHCITNLVVIGGDGSLTGANLFRNEWSDLVEELLQRGEVDKVEAEECRHLAIVGMVSASSNILLNKLKWEKNCWHCFDAGWKLFKSALQTRHWSRRVH